MFGPLRSIFVAQAAIPKQSRSAKARKRSLAKANMDSEDDEAAGSVQPLPKKQKLTQVAPKQVRSARRGQEAAFKMASAASPASSSSTTTLQMSDAAQVENAFEGSSLPGPSSLQSVGQSSFGTEPILQRAAFISDGTTLYLTPRGLQTYAFLR